MLIKVGFKDSKGAKQFATYTTDDQNQVDRIVKREKKKKNVVSIQVGSKYVYGGPNA